jgi:hypothetical protein
MSRLIPALLCWFAVFSLSSCCVSLAGAQEAIAKRETASPTQEDEANAIAFVEKHQPELASLLQVLKSMKPAEYQSALREIIRAKKRMDAVEKRDTKLFELDLDSWKLQSKIDLLLARSVAKENGIDQATLKSLVQRLVSNQKERLKREKDNLIERQKQIEDQLAKLNENEEDRVSQQLANMLRKVDSKKLKQKNGQ